MTQRRLLHNSLYRTNDKERVKVWKWVQVSKKRNRTFPVRTQVTFEEEKINNHPQDFTPESYFAVQLHCKQTQTISKSKVIVQFLQKEQHNQQQEQQIVGKKKRTKSSKRILQTFLFV